MLYIERNRKINAVDDLTAFTRARVLKMEQTPYSSGRIGVTMYLSGLINRRTVENRIYKLNLQPLPLGGYEVYNVERVYSGNINEKFRGLY